MSQPGMLTTFPFWVAVVSEKSPFWKPTVVNLDTPPGEMVAVVKGFGIIVEDPVAVDVAATSKFDTPFAVVLVSISI